MRVNIVHAQADAEFAVRLAGRLEGAGVTVVAGGEDVDASVCLLSLESAFSDDWHSSVSTLPDSARVVPVRLDDTPASALPSRLTDVHWVDMTHDEAFETSLGVLLVGLDTHPRLHRRIKDLSVMVESWTAGGRPDRLLIQDVEHAERMSAVVRAAQPARDIRTPTEADVYVASSLRHSLGKRRTRRFRLLVAVGFLVVGAAAAATFFVRFDQILDQNKAGVALNPAGQGIEDMPEWTSMLAAAALAEEVPYRFQSAREILRATLTQRWGLGGVGAPTSYAIDAITPLADGERALVVLRAPDEPGTTYLSLYHPHKSEYEWSVEVLPQSIWISVDATESQAVVSAADGFAIVDLATKTVSKVATAPLARAVFSRSGVAILMQDGVLSDRAPDGTVTELVSSGEVLDLATDAGGDARALVLVDDKYTIVDGSTGGVLAEARIQPPVIHSGALMPAGDVAVVAGADRQLWVIEREAARPIGFAIPDFVTTIVGLPGYRVAVGGQATPVQVVDVRTGVSLGDICTDGADFVTLSASPHSGVVGCRQSFMGTFWPAPDSATSTPTGPLRSGLGDELDDDSIEIRRGQIRVNSGAVGASSWVPATEAEIVTAAWSPDHSALLVGSGTGEVTILEMTAAGPVVTVRWMVPTASPVQMAGWPDGPQVGTADGWYWRVPECKGCATDAGLIESVVERLHACWTARQLDYLAERTRERFGVRLCDDFDLRVQP